MYTVHKVTRFSKTSGESFNILYQTMPRGNNDEKQKNKNKTKTKTKLA